MLHALISSSGIAVDNVLERFVEINKRNQILREEQILRVATDISKVNKDLQSFTIDARVGGDMNENNRLYKKAKERLDAAVIVFTTCAGKQPDSLILSRLTSMPFRRGRFRNS